MNWYLENGKESDIVLSTSIKLARNLEGYPFTNKCNVKQKEEILSKLEEIVPNLGYGLQILKLKDMDNTSKQSLVEKNIISIDFAEGDCESKAIITNKEENICIEVNGEDHLLLQVFSEGLAVDSLLNLAIEIDKKIETNLQYAYNQKYGYLTACPTNVGTGMHISTKVHLPALKITGNINKILRIISNFGMTATGEYGEGYKAQGDIYQICNNQTLGITEEEIAKNIIAITEKVISGEREARGYLGKSQIEFTNEVYRNFGLLKYSKILTLDECIYLLSSIKLGTDMGIIKELDDSKVKKLYLYTKPANLQKYFGQEMNQKEQNIKRCEIITNIIENKI